MCVGQPCDVAACQKKPLEILSTPSTEAAAASIAQAWFNGLLQFPEGSERAQECTRRRSELAAHLAEVQHQVAELSEATSCMAISTSSIVRSAELAAKLYSYCVALRHVAEVLEAQEKAYLPGAVVTSNAGLVADISLCQMEVRKLAQSVRRQAPPKQAEAWGCMGGLFKLCAKKEKTVAVHTGAHPASPAPASPAGPADQESRRKAFLRTLMQQQGAAPRVFCSDVSIAKDLFTDARSGFGVCVTCVVTDPMEAMRLTRAMGEGKIQGCEMMPGSPRGSAQSLAARGSSFDVVILERRHLSELPTGLLAPGGCFVPVEDLPSELEKVDKSA